MPIVAKELKGKSGNRRKFKRPRLGWLKDAKNDFKKLKVKRRRQKANNVIKGTSVLTGLQSRGVSNAIFWSNMSRGLYSQNDTPGSRNYLEMKKYQDHIMWSHQVCTSQETLYRVIYLEAPN
jgi:hypothetical protein